ncbi:hypothetical protein HPP92_018891 [Vanilla planifolia]|uniref:Fe2OG dioxygenase domain-containing protein n=1 Tax=Vanilla planifolia TaxID=51239 RepID=A0A835QAQ8_VANPL|nr:hypothetical protein HPP92_018891 [Vanilla planifolia]
MAVETISLPCIDLENFPSELGKLTAAATGLGCFRVVNHGIPVELMKEAKAAASSFSKRPIDTKLRNSNVIHNGGYLSRRYYMPLLESFGIYDAASTADVLAFCSSMEASHRQREVLSTYACRVHALAVDIASKVAEGLGVLDFSFQDWHCTMRLNVYDLKEETIGLQAMGLHSDSSFLTVLLEGEVNGLEVVDQTGKFVAVHSQPGTFLAFIGDMGKVWSNGRLRNVHHRVICTQAGPRISISFSVVSPRDGVVVPPAPLVNEEHPRIYRSVPYNEYREFRRTPSSFDGSLLSLYQAEE